MSWPVSVRRLVDVRSGGVCEGCGKRPGANLHHRKYRSRGGPDTVENALWLCGSGNHTGCHGVAHSQTGHDNGWSVNSWADETHEPVLYRGELRILTSWGSAVLITETEWS